jgi:hypothetical protein
MELKSLMASDIINQNRKGDAKNCDPNKTYEERNNYCSSMVSTDQIERK